MKTKNIFYIIAFIAVVAICLIFSSCKKNETPQPVKPQTVQEYYDAPVLTAIKEIQRAVTDPNIDGEMFQAMVDSTEDHITMLHDMVSPETQRLWQTTLRNIEIRYNFYIDFYEGRIE